MVIYVDVLFVVNFFITYLLLFATSFLAKSEMKQYRAIIASLAGGLYSLVIICDKLNFLISTLGKIAVSILIVFIAFGFKRFTVFLKNFFVFYFSNLIFLGVIYAVYMYFSPNGVTVKNSSVYFNITATQLVLSAFGAYIVTFIIIKITNRTLAKGEIYSLSIFTDDKEYKLFPFADSGNKLKEPFSDYPVIIVDKSKIPEKCERLIPCQTVSGEGMLKAFKPDKVIISSSKNKIELTKVYVAFSEVKSKSFSAILSNELINI